jgi:Asp-tRNA(Asn)/Glu-tRNA(Gln) amidotransferase A subunit family amidase
VSASSGLDLALTAQAEAIGSGELDPEQLLEECLERIEERNPELNAVVDTFPDESRRMLAEAPDGPLHGVPVVIKDEWPLPWRAERVGAASILVEVSPGESGPYLALRDAGAVIVGVANMHELGSGSTGAISVHGAAHNPWDLDRAPGGSSSGPAAAVAGGLVSGAVGADGLGSIRYPAAYCGLTGLKPTFGRSTMEGHHIANTETIVSGPLCHDAADCRLLASVLFGEELAAAVPGRLRIGVVREPLWNDCTSGVLEACEQALEALREEVGGGVQEVELNDIDLYLVAALIIAQSEEAGELTPEKLNALSPDLSPINRGILKLRSILPGTLLPRAELVRARARRVLARLFEQVDLLAWPAVAAVAPPLADPRVALPSGESTADQSNARQGTIANLTGVPGISIPAGLSDGMPVGLQLLGAWGSDARLLDAAEALERATDRQWVEARPPIATADVGELF